MLVALAANAPSLVVHSASRSLALRVALAARAHLSVAMAETASPADALRGLDDEDCGCDDVTTTPAKTALVNDVVVAASLRSLALARRRPARRRADRRRRRGGGVLPAPPRMTAVLGLRARLGKRRPEMAAAGVAGPLFVSVGQPDQLQKFYELNPELKGCPALIDTSADFSGYKAAGFSNLLGESVPETPPDFKPPKTMGGMKWLS